MDDEQEKQERLIEMMAARIFERMVAMPHGDLCYRMQYYDPSRPGGPLPLEIAEYARMAARSFYARLKPAWSSEDEKEEPTP